MGSLWILWGGKWGGRELADQMIADSGPGAGVRLAVFGTSLSFFSVCRVYFSVFFVFFISELQLEQMSLRLWICFCLYLCLCYCFVCVYVFVYSLHQASWLDVLWFLLSGVWCCSATSCKWTLTSELKIRTLIISMKSLTQSWWRMCDVMVEDVWCHGALWWSLLWSSLSSVHHHNQTVRKRVKCI